MISFKQFLSEKEIVIDAVTFDFGTHFLERLALRSKIDKSELIDALTKIQESLGTNDFVSLVRKIRSKLKDIPEKGEFLFYSKQLGQGVIAAWDAMRSKLKFITFLPQGKHQPKTGTQEIVLEGYESIIVIDID